MRLQVTCQNRMGITQEVLNILVKRNIDLRGIETDPVGRIYVSIPEIAFAEFQTLMPELRHIHGVSDVKTIAFMPSERGHFELKTLLQTLPDPVLSISAKGQILHVNDAAIELMGNAPAETIIGSPISQWIKGFNFSRWLEAEEVLAQTQRMRVQDEDFIADILPVIIPEEGNASKTYLAGAVVNLKSESRLSQQVVAFRQTDTESFNQIHATSSAMRKVIREAKKMALLQAPILIHGETGTGKELLAKACHQASDRSDKPFLALNCASLPDNVAESELFGYGPKDSDGVLKQGKKGIFEQADGGTVFLDEVGEMSPRLQSKLLRFMQDGTFRRIGEDKEVSVEVRVICTTQSDLLELVQNGRFREDLYYRLNVLSLEIPPLRERKSDISGLVHHFIKRSAQQLGANSIQISEDCLQFIIQYPWPGNVRQLENALYRAISLIESGKLQREHIQLPNYSSTLGYLDEEFEGSLDEAVKRYEASILRKLYPAYPSTRQLAAKLGLSHTAIANKLREYEINKRTVKS